MVYAEFFGIQENVRHIPRSECRIQHRRVASLRRNVNIFIEVLLLILVYKLFAVRNYVHVPCGRPVFRMVEVVHKRAAALRVVNRIE